VATSTETVQTEAPAQPHLKRVLSLWDLIYYGVILTSPIAAVPLFGEGQVLSHGHTVATLLLAMVAMSVTAVSFGRMASVYPSSGSVYTYISRELNPHLGFVIGWAMFLERTVRGAHDSADDTAHPVCDFGRPRRRTHYVHDSARD
jgi:amino acid transporter